MRNIEDLRARRSPPIDVACGSMAKRNHGVRIAKDLVGFAMENKLYWLLPLVLVSLVLVALVVLSATPLAPFIYSVF